MAQISEIGRHTALNCQAVKRITSGVDRLNARALHKEGGDFLQLFKVVLSTNYLPLFDAQDKVAKRTVPVLFARAFNETTENTRYAAQLKDHANEFGFFWLEGARAYYRDQRFEYCSMVQDWRDNYLLEMSPTLAFVKLCRSEKANEDELERRPTEQFSRKIHHKPRQLFEAYATWFTHVQREWDQDEMLSEAAFGREIKRMGYVKAKLDERWVYYGIELSQELTAQLKAAQNC